MTTPTKPTKKVDPLDRILGDMIRIPVSKPTALNQCGQLSIVYPPKREGVDLK
jgi:hypothetical protein